MIKWISGCKAFSSVPGTVVSIKLSLFFIFLNIINCLKIFLSWHRSLKIWKYYPYVPAGRNIHTSPPYMPELCPPHTHTTTKFHLQKKIGMEMAFFSISGNFLTVRKSQQTGRGEYQWGRAAVTGLLLGHQECSSHWWPGENKLGHCIQTRFAGALFFSFLSFSLFSPFFSFLFFSTQEAP